MTPINVNKTNNGDEDPAINCVDPASHKALDKGMDKDRKWSRVAIERAPREEHSLGGKDPPKT